MKTRTKTVDMSKIPDVDLDEITMRGVCSRDTLDAAERCDVPDGTDVDPTVMGIMLRQQMICGAIVSYKLRGSSEQKIVAGPAVEALDWSTRTMEFVGEIYSFLNGVRKDERDGFLEMLAGNA